MKHDAKSYEDIQSPIYSKKIEARESYTRNRQEWDAVVLYSELSEAPSATAVETATTVSRSGFRMFGAQIIQTSVLEGKPRTATHFARTRGQTQTYRTVPGYTHLQSKAGKQGRSSQSKVIHSSGCGTRIKSGGGCSCHRCHRKQRSRESTAHRSY